MKIIQLHRTRPHRNRHGSLWLFVSGSHRKIYSFRSQSGGELCAALMAAGGLSHHGLSCNTPRRICTVMNVVRMVSRAVGRV